MKNIKTFAVLLAATTIFACDPFEDEVNKIEEERVEVRAIEYTLTDDDYGDIDDECECSGFGSFSSLDDVKAGVSFFLGDHFPALGKNSSAIVTYKFFNGSSPDLRKTQFIYTVTAEEYDELGFGFGNFSDLTQDIPLYANFKEPDAGDGMYMDITHDFFNGSFTESDVVTRAVYTVAYGWQYAFVLPDDAYGDFFGESGIDFSTSDEGKEKMPVYLNEFNSLFVDEGTVMVVQFNHDDDNAGPLPDVGLYIFSGGEWLLYNDHFQTTAETLSFGHNGTEWVPDNTIRLNLDGGDYDAIGATYATSNPSGSSSITSFKNFDISLWTPDQIFESVTDRLLVKDGIIKEDGQKYVVTYATWKPGAGTGELSLVYSGADSAFITNVE